MKIQKLISKWPLVMAAVGLMTVLALAGCTDQNGGSQTDTMENSATQAQLYTCSMHPEVISEEPGECPICGMDLVPVSSTESAGEQEMEHQHDTMENMDSGGEEAAQLWTCSMHPEVVSEEPGECPICGMDLVPVSSTSENVETSSIGERGEILYWQAPMDPSYISDEPGKSPMGMDLVPVYEGDQSLASTITIDPVVVQNMGVRTARVEQRNLSREVRALGRVTYDETKMAHLHTKIDGYIEETYVAATGQQVNRGEPLVAIYSPELVSTQEEYLQIYRTNQRALNNGNQSEINRTEDMLASVRRRLEFWDIPDAQIRRLEEEGTVTKTMTLNSPFNGVVIQKTAVDGMRVQPGMKLYEIADLSTVWVEADIYEYELPWIEEGQSVEMQLSYLPGSNLQGYVDYIYPYLNDKTRTVTVRTVFSNEDHTLKPGMYTNVRIQSELDGQPVSIPEESVIWSGERTLLFVSMGDGRYVPRDVRLGALGSGGYYEVLAGVQPGETVVTSGQFMLDSESKLKEAIQKMMARRETGSAAANQSPESSMEMESMENGSDNMEQNSEMQENDEAMEMSMN